MVLLLTLVLLPALYSATQAAFEGGAVPYHVSPKCCCQLLRPPPLCNFFSAGPTLVAAIRQHLIGPLQEYRMVSVLGWTSSCGSTCVCLCRHAAGCYDSSLKTGCQLQLRDV